jgi:hypothetical protein
MLSGLRRRDFERDSKTAIVALARNRQADERAAEPAAPRPPCGLFRLGARVDGRITVEQWPTT